MDKPLIYTKLIMAIILILIAAVFFIWLVCVMFWNYGAIMIIIIVLGIFGFSLYGEVRKEIDALHQFEK